MSKESSKSKISKNILIGLGAALLLASCAQNEGWEPSKDSSKPNIRSAVKLSPALENQKQFLGLFSADITMSGQTIISSEIHSLSAALSDVIPKVKSTLNLGSTADGNKHYATTLAITNRSQTDITIPTFLPISTSHTINNTFFYKAQDRHGVQSDPTGIMIEQGYYTNQGKIEMNPQAEKLVPVNFKASDILPRPGEKITGVSNKAWQSASLPQNASQDVQFGFSVPPNNTTVKFSLLFAIMDSGNNIPTADFTFDPITPTVGQKILFDAKTLSKDTDGNIAQYVFDFGDGTQQITNTTGFLDHTFSKVGSYTINVHVVDNKGAKSLTKTKTINITLPSPLAEYNMDNCQNLGEDQSSQNWHLTQYGGISCEQDSDGNFARFDGRTGYFKLNDKQKLGFAQDFSITANVRFKSTGRDYIYDWECLFCKGWHEENYALMFSHPVASPTTNQTDNTLAFYYESDGLPDTQYVGKLDPERWYNIAVTYGSNTGKIYLDGQLVKSSPMTNGVKLNDGLLHIGASSKLNSNKIYSYFFRGDMKKVKFFNKELNSDEISGFFDIEKPKNQKPTADFSYNPTEPLTGQIISFDAKTLSKVFDGSIVEYVFDFGDGSQKITSTTGFVHHSFAKAGNYKVNVYAVDDKGVKSSTKTREIKVNFKSYPYLVAEYNMDNCQNLGEDQSSKNWHLIKYGDVSCIQDPNGNFARFDGRTGYFKLDDKQKLGFAQDFSISASVRFRSTGKDYIYAWECLFCKDSHEENYALMFSHPVASLTTSQTDNTLAFYYEGSGWPDAQYVGKLESEKWYDVVVTYGPTEGKVYLDGTLVKSVPIKSGMKSNDGLLHIGVSNVTGGNKSYFFHGDMKKVKFFNKELDSNDIKEILE